MSMKKFVLEFLRRGFIAFGVGPVVLAIIYLILNATDMVETLTVRQVSVGIFSLAALAFISSGMNAIYQVERLPLMVAILIHGSVLYIGYLITYLLNDWLDFGTVPVIVFTAIFIVGYIVIWGIIYSIIKKNTVEINEKLRAKQQNFM